MPDNMLYLDAIGKKKVSRTPIWIMRQAGRYLPEYMKIRNKHDFMTVCKTPELATEVTLQPIRRFGFDAAILFSDILVIPEAMGQKLEFLKDHGPRLSPQILDHKDLENLRTEDLEDKLEYVAAAVSMIRGALDRDIALIGFSGSPWTLATYMIEGKPSKNFKYIKSMVYSNPDLLHKLLHALTEAVVRYLRMQVRAGAQALQVFDTWGGMLPPHLYPEFSGTYMKKIVDQLRDTGVPVTLFGRGGIELLRQLTDSGASMLGVDWMTDMQEARNIAGASHALQGNLDPTALYGSHETIGREVRKVLEVFGGESGHVFNLGHGILPDIPIDNVQFLVDTVREVSQNMHR
jgi:uroporphyrinogen decarboxylase